ncbi:MAG TPA: hypothetical protein VEZ41_05325 [Allosphingosinicella sp.]|nr:hypothetical protein [Allosphingosinicella sp.]
MAYTATVVPIMLASPGDVGEEREEARAVINTWNYINSLSSNVVLIPVGWETHSAPDLAGRAQELINDRVLADCDLLVGIFWTRLGTPTGNSASGTVEEIERHLDVGKPAMVYFSTKPVALDSVNLDQYKALKDFKTWCEGKGLIETFDDLNDFRDKFTRQLQLLMNQNSYLSDIVSAEAPVAPIAQPEQPQLSAEARELLVHAVSDPSGIIMKIATLGGRYIQTNGQTFGDPRDRRSGALWEYALEQLVNLGLVIERGLKGEMFEVTQPGYLLGDQLKQGQGA